MCAECFTPCISCCYHLWNRKELTNDFEVLAHKKSVQSFIEYIVYIYHWQYTSVSRILSVFFFFCVLFVCLFVLMESRGYEQQREREEKGTKSACAESVQMKNQRMLLFWIKRPFFCFDIGWRANRKISFPKEKVDSKKEKE